jgi:hypothetical protein
MKRILPILVGCAISLATTVTMAAPVGIRYGLTFDPDQFHVGIHSVLAEPFPNIAFTPNLEIGLGDHLTVIAFNAELIYPAERSAYRSWRAYVGGGLGLNHYDWDSERRHDDSRNDIGLNILGGMSRTLRSGNEIFFELKLGLEDSPDVKLTSGFTFD